MDNDTSKLYSIVEGLGFIDSKTSISNLTTIVMTTLHLDCPLKFGTFRFLNIDSISYLIRCRSKSSERKWIVFKVLALKPEILWSLVQIPSSKCDTPSPLAENTATEGCASSSWGIAVGTVTPTPQAMRSLADSEIQWPGLMITLFNKYEGLSQL